jgi:hypothetical protein
MDERILVPKLRGDSKNLSFERVGLSRNRDIETGCEFEWDYRDSLENAVRVSFLLPGTISICEVDLIDPTGRSRRDVELPARHVLCSKHQLLASFDRSLKRFDSWRLPAPAELTANWLLQMAPYVFAGWEKSLTNSFIFGPKLSIEMVDDFGQEQKRN